LAEPTGAEGRLYADVAGDMGSDSPILKTVMIITMIYMVIKMKIG
jgi:hypothetical protein